MERDNIVRLKEAVDIVDVVGSRVKLTRKGANYLGLCPFHDEKTPSLVVNPTKGIYKCFGCGAGGDCITFIREHDQLDLRDACKEVANIGGVVFEDTYAVNFQEAKVTKELKKVFGETTHSGRNYLAKRALDVDHLPLLKGTKFAVESPVDKIFECNFHKEKLEGYITFPIYSHAGQLVAWAARNVNGTADQSKYINSVNHKYFDKSATLYGYYHHKQAIRKAGVAVVTEGYFDVNGLEMIGITNTVATCGTALTEEHCKAIRRLVPKVDLAYDGDEAGIKATIKAIPIALDQGLVVDVIPFEPGQDPDDWRLDNPEGKLEGLNWVDWYHAYVYSKNGTDAEKKAELLNTVREIVQNCKNTIIRSVYADDVKRLWNIELSLDDGPELAPIERKVETEELIDPMEREILRCLVFETDYLGHLDEMLGDITMSDTMAGFIKELSTGQALTDSDNVKIYADIVASTPEDFKPNIEASVILLELKLAEKALLRHKMMAQTNGLCPELREKIKRTREWIKQTKDYRSKLLDEQ